MSRRKRREEIAAELAARVAAESAPVPGLDQMAAANRWMAVGPPVLSDEDIGCICRVALGTHGVTDPDKRRRQFFSQLFLEPSMHGPTYAQYEQARLVHCYQGEFNGRAFGVGNAFYDIPLLFGPAGYGGGPMGAPDELGAAFCAVSLPAPFPWVQLIRAAKAWFPGSNNGLGYPELDAHFTAFCPNRNLARRIVGPEIASLVASRGDWGLSLHRATLACVTAAPIASGNDAAQLVAATTRMVGLLPASPLSLL
jgi:hypothetical protein